MTHGGDDPSSRGLRRYPKPKKTPHSIFLTELCTGLPEFRLGETRRTSVILSVSVSASVGMSFVRLASFVFLTLSVFTPFYTHTNAQTRIPVSVLRFWRHDVRIALRGSLAKRYGT